MSIRDDYRHTFYCCYITYVIQAAIVTVPPLLFITFSEEFGLGLDRITLLTTLNFGIQLVFDVVSMRAIDILGYRKSMAVSHIFIAVGLVSMAVLPSVLDDPYLGLIVSILIFGTGGGISEVVVNPIVVSCPTDSNEGALTRLHSAFSWGQASVVLLSTAFIFSMGASQWRTMVCLWALLPIANLIYSLFVPMADGGTDGNVEKPLQGLLRQKAFWVFFILMVCGGSAGHAMEQWVSAFAEESLKVDKSIGDITGLCLFSVFMAMSRTIYGKYNGRLNLYRFMFLSTLMCILCYATAAFSPFSWLALAGCALCGFSIGIFWPGTLGLASNSIVGGGTAMFALLSLAGDIGCSTGPTVVGFVANACNGNLGMGMAVATVFPALMAIYLYTSRRRGIL